VAELALAGHSLALQGQAHGDGSHDARLAFESLGDPEGHPDAGQNDQVAQLGRDEIVDLHEPREKKCNCGADDQADDEPAEVGPQRGAQVGEPV